MPNPRPLAQLHYRRPQGRLPAHQLLQSVLVHVTGLNHLTLATADLSRAFDFYAGVLGCRPRARWARGAYLSADDLWLCLSLDADSRPSVDYTHVAFSVAGDALDAWRDRLEGAGVRFWKTNTSEGDSLYVLDPDGHRLELHVGDLDSRLAALQDVPYDGLELFP